MVLDALFGRENITIESFLKNLFCDNLNIFLSLESNHRKNPIKIY